ncbi:hypothetical protein HK414_00905 [Ramlibacter terrae]|uniref:Mut7-C RNAse domain-containing protein n=1 Tax=Ramlibacter terrae TaxID=2732511 RepID=A0ABX6P155_9BURK|nr:hypothetical protein HK414_00905 [Ramlibacter terrae]
MADAMLGRLARWLRVLGFDTVYDEALDDPVLVRIADADGRVLLTRDRHLLRDLRPLRAHEVRQDDPMAQLVDLVHALQLAPPAGLFTRCLVCNTELPAPLPEEELPALLPFPRAQVPGPVRRCPTCGRLYWHGSHARRMRAALDRALPGWGTAG